MNSVSSYTQEQSPPHPQQSSCGFQFPLRSCRTGNNCIFLLTIEIYIFAADLSNDHIRIFSGPCIKYRIYKKESGQFSCVRFTRASSVLGPSCGTDIIRGAFPVRYSTWLTISYSRTNLSFFKPLSGALPAHDKNNKTNKETTPDILTNLSIGNCINSSNAITRTKPESTSAPDTQYWPDRASHNS